MQRSKKDILRDIEEVKTMCLGASEEDKKVCFELHRTLRKELVQFTANGWV